MLFMKGSPDAPRCGFSARVVEALQSADISFGHFDILSVRLAALELRCVATCIACIRTSRRARTMHVHSVAPCRLHEKLHATCSLHARSQSKHLLPLLQDEEVRSGLKAFSDWPTYPQLYAKGELVGGCDIIMELQAAGELKSEIEAAG